MADPHLNLIERFAEYEEQIRELTETNPAFNTIAHEFNQVADELDRAEAREGTDTNTDTLRRRKQALQDETLMLLRQSTRL